jgi:predicted site-specific integrase-resolvase
MKLSEYARRNSITYRTAFLHWQIGLLNGKQLATGTIVIFDDAEEESRTHTYCIYCRVSSHDQKEDLGRQEQRLKDYCSAKGWKVSAIYSEIASGLNDDRPKFNKALSSFDNIVVEHRDRLTRFGFNYIQTLLSKQNRKIEVINESENKHDIVQDFISIITSFCARIYGHRRSRRKTESLIKELQLENCKK